MGEVAMVACSDREDPQQVKHDRQYERRAT